MHIFCTRHYLIPLVYRAQVLGMVGCGGEVQLVRCPQERRHAPLLWDPVEKGCGHAQPGELAWQRCGHIIQHHDASLGQHTGCQGEVSQGTLQRMAPINGEEAKAGETQR